MSQDIIHLNWLMILPTDDGIVPFLEVCQEVVVELHVDVCEVIDALLGLPEFLELLVGGLDGADGAIGENGAFLRETGAVLSILSKEWTSHHFNFTCVYSSRRTVHQ